MALNCGHRGVRSADRLLAGLCPVCPTAPPDFLDVHTQVIHGHRHCQCCGECWAIRDGEVVYVEHP